MTNHNPELTKLCGVWRKQSKNGNEYFVGRLGASKLIILANKKAEFDDEPDFHIFVQNTPDQQRQAKPAPKRSNGPTKQQVQAELDYYQKTAEWANQEPGA